MKPADAPRLRLILVLGALSTFAPLATDMYLPGLPQITRDLSASPSAAQLTLSACLIGLAGGQLLAGPISDATGRRRPLLIGIGLFVTASCGCAAAPSLPLLLLARCAQGAAGATGIAIARAIIRDRAGGAAAARAFATLMAFTSVGPIIAPTAGGLLLQITTWRGVFVALALIGVALLIAAACGIEETLPPSGRATGGLASTPQAIRLLLADRVYLTIVMSGALCAATLLSFIAAAPFLLERIHGLSTAQFSLVFAANGSGILIVRQCASRALDAHPPTTIMRCGLLVQCAGAVAMLAFTSLWPALVPTLVCAFLSVASVGAIMPMAVALALEAHATRAGTASGLFGFAQFSVSALLAPLVGIAGPLSALPMALTMATCSLLATALACARLPGLHLLSGASSALPRVTPTTKGRT